MSKTKKNIVLATTIITIIFVAITAFCMYYSILEKVVYRMYGKPYESGDFLCYEPSYNRQQILIVGLSESGKEKEVLHIPKTLNNKIVAYYGEKIVVPSDGAKVKRIYVHGVTRCTMHEYRQGGVVVINLNPYLYYIPTRSESRWNDYKEGHSTSYKYIEGVNIKSDKTLRYSNVLYDYNYSGSEDFYFLDNYEDSIITYKPKDPVRNGYKFAGWYKDTECTTPWDFSTDKVPEKHREENTVSFTKTILYAKWIEN